LETGRDAVEGGGEGRGVDKDGSRSERRYPMNWGQGRRSEEGFWKWDEVHGNSFYAE
jgi:hypothetical protein